MGGGTRTGRPCTWKGGWGAEQSRGGAVRWKQRSEGRLCLRRRRKGPQGPRAKECGRPLEAGRGKGRSSPGPWEGPQPSAVLSHCYCGHLLRQSQETATGPRIARWSPCSRGPTGTPSVTLCRPWAVSGDRSRASRRMPCPHSGEARGTVAGGFSLRGS